MPRKYGRIFCVSAVLISLSLLTADDPTINQRFALNERDISPPAVGKPIHDCARAVHVAGFICKAQIRVFANGVEVGHGTSKLSDLDVQLIRALHLGEQVTATQTVQSFSSDPSDPVPVDAYPSLTKPVVTTDVYACGRVARVENLVASTHVEVSDVDAAGAPVIGTAENTGTVAPVFTSPLVEGHHLSAVQIACPDQPGKVPPSAQSASVKVKPSPVMMPKPAVEKGFVEGSEVLFAHGLLPGAEIEFKAGSTVISSGHFANMPDNWFPMDVPVPPGNPKITARQKLCTWGPPSDPVVPSRDLAKPVLGGVCEDSRIVSIDNTLPGANVVLFRKPAGGGSAVAIGYGGGVPGTLMLHVGKGVTLQTRDVLSAVQYVGSIVSPFSDDVRVGCGGGFNVITQHNDNFRSGAYLTENTLLPAAVLRQGMQEAFPPVNLEGGVDTQALYVRELQFQGGGANVVFVATQKNIVYGIHANNGNIIWRHPLLDTNPARSDQRGVDTTPVIDVAANRMYVLFSTANKPFDPNALDYKTPGMDIAFWLAALDLRDGHELERRQVAAWVYDDAGAKVNFIGKNQVAHPALLLDHGSLYIAFGSMAAAEGDPAYLSQYHGWVMRYRAFDLALQSVFCTSPNQDGRPSTVNPGGETPGGGIWQGGGGLAADPDGNIYFLTGNGRADIQHALFGDSFLKLAVSGETLVPTAFTPSPPLDPNPDLIESEDADLGSGGALVIPGLNLVIGGGKPGWMYLLDRTAMSFRQRLTAATNLRTGKRVEAVPGAWKQGPHLHGSPTLWKRSDARFLYVWGEKDVLRQFRFDAASNKFTEPEIHKATIVALENAMPGGTLSISANGDRRGTGVVWATLPAEDKMGLTLERLYAFSADDLTPLWDIQFGYGPHWAPPTIADGMVYVPGGDGKLFAYKLGPPGDRSSWPPTQPGPPVAQCQSCHTAGQLTDLQRRWPLEKRFTNEASLRSLPAIALRLSSPPAGASKLMTLEGGGIRTYYAVGNPGKLKWMLKETTADLVTLKEPGERSANDVPVHVRLDPGWVWSADGNRIVGRVEKTTPAPEHRDIPWTLFRIQSPADSGALRGVRYIQWMNTHAGRPPDRGPARAGEVARVPFYARYRLYH